MKRPVDEVTHSVTELNEDDAEAGPVRRVILIGFMAAGKSTVGRALAKRLGWSFIDLDHEIEKRTGITIPEIFELHGAAEFRRLERVLTEELTGLEEAVLAPGGGWVTQPDLLDLFGAETLIVWLRISPEAAVQRAMRTISHRPLLASAPDPVERARELISEREPLYQLADLRVDVEGRSINEVASEIVGMIG